MDKLSKDAISLAFKFQSPNLSQISSFLYGYNRLAFTPRLRKLFRSENIIEALYGEFFMPAELYEIFHVVPSQQHKGYWWSFTNRELTNHNGFDYKLYICPTPDNMSSAFRTFIAQENLSLVSSFKVVSTKHGLCRPDKFVAYFSSAKDRSDFVMSLANEMLKYAAQPAPFTQNITETGILSQATDVLYSGMNFPKFKSSWRVSISKIIAKGILSLRESYQHQDEDTSLVRLQNYLELEGINHLNWTSYEIETADNL